MKTEKKMANHAQKSGDYAVGMIAPGFFKPATVDVLVDYCSQVAAIASEVVFYFYHMPSMTGVNFSMVNSLEKACGRIPNLAGIKYTYEDLMDYYLCRTFEGGRFDILFGRDEILLSGLVLKVDCGPVRLPLTDITDKQYESVIGRLEKIGFFEFCGGQPFLSNPKTKSKCQISEIKI